MITLITGTPGKGKTALAVQMIQKLAEDRPIFADGIKELKIPHHPIPHIDEWVRSFVSPTGGEDYEWIGFPPDAVIVIDEAQRFFRPRHVSKPPHPAVAGFETHRQAGIDFIILTQKRSFIDSHIRGLLDVHIHIQDGMLGRFSYTWFREGDPESKADLKEASRKKYSPPKEVFGLYKSAELHTKQKREKPLLLYVGAFSAIAFVFLAYRIITSVSERNETVKEASADESGLPLDLSGKKRVLHSNWRIVGVIESPRFRVVLSDGRVQRVIEPDSFRRVGASIEASSNGETFTTWARLSEK